MTHCVPYGLDSMHLPGHTMIGLLPLLSAILLIRTSQAQVSVYVNGDVFGFINTDVTLRCRTETKEHVTQLTWQKKKTPNNEDFLTYSKGEQPVYLTPFAKERVTFLGNGDQGGNILIRNVTLADEGIYLCSFSTHPTGTKEKEIKLHIMVRPFVTVILPPIKTQTTMSIVAECTAMAAKPAGEIKWITSETHATSNITTYQHENGTVTTKSQLSMVPSPGLYGQKATCVVSQANIELPEEKNFVFDNIQYPPQDVNITVHRNAAEGKLELKCLADANPPVSYTWKRDNGEISDGTIHQFQSLMVSDTDIHQPELYICETRNIVGSQSGIAYLYKTDSACQVPLVFLVIFVILVIVLSVGLIYLIRERRNNRQPKYHEADDGEIEITQQEDSHDGKGRGQQEAAEGQL
ncbi:nectin-1-like [Pelobates fuscus]|uniref:nectin-1-like n=1 Tax=Pelobates fuscus TaxID=191477 RepID=UPI002FE49C7F